MEKVYLEKINKNNNILKKMFITKKVSFYNFLINIILFFILIFLVLLNQFCIKSNILHYVDLAFSGYLLLIFTFIGWFSTEYYYRKIKVLDIDLIEEGKNFKSYRLIELNSIKFVLINIFLSFISVLIFVFEILSAFEDHILVREIGIISIHLLLIPGFVRMFETIIEALQKFKKLLDHFLIKQFDILENLFEHVKFEKNNTRLLFTDYNIKSRHNIFLLSSDYLITAEKETVENTNKKILNIYKELWNQYLKVFSIYLSSDMKKSSKRLQRKVRKILIYYLMIWDDFFEF
ncbi:hypothetical protein [Spiroplasma turonicum]|uniref:Transmembrane protein n=1 Tax=Spiroplasma turonicum TaxID=216946 RepID=A0A0K1P7A8_9MOLU|nr:hypothetical protein [Spiroplasma turonicum]AKU80168.1 hypothetical protein STURON_00922 [Spiroplasma turonicum]ALX71168.1 hypothetical protein STURO_v1c09170 [Spiroplasma turonicum]